jgi:hypothetical protein
MSHEVKYIGMDVHKEAIVIAVLDGSGKLVMETILEARWEKGNKPEEGWAWPAPTKSGHAEHDSIRVQHKNAIKASKVVKFVVYSFRHTFLTRLGESGCDTWTLARIAGHSSIKMSERYVHPSNDACCLPCLVCHSRSCLHPIRSRRINEERTRYSSRYSPFVRPRVQTPNTLKRW